MGSSSRATTRNTTNNLALQASATNGAGTQILDSIIVDPSDTVMVRTIEEHRAAFEVLMSNSTVQLSELLAIGQDVLRLADNQAIRMSEAGYYQLEQGVRMLEESMTQGRYVIDFVEEAANQTFDLANNVTTGNDDRLEQALDLVADVKTESFADTLKTVSTLMIVFGLGALYLTTRNQ